LVSTFLKKEGYQDRTEKELILFEFCNKFYKYPMNRGNNQQSDPEAGANQQKWGFYHPKTNVFY
jgi:hypothetical protein